MVAQPKIPKRGSRKAPLVFPQERGPRGYISFPIYPNWIFTRLRDAGYRPRDGSVRCKHIDVPAYRQRFTLQLPLKYVGITPDIIRDVINVGSILHCQEVRLRKNLKWIGITIIIDAVGLQALGR